MRMEAGLAMAVMLAAGAHATGAAGRNTPPSTIDSKVLVAEESSPTGGASAESEGAEQGPAAETPTAVEARRENAPAADTPKAVEAREENAPAGAAQPSADEILDAVDRNLTFATRTARSVMTVEGRRTRTYELVTYGRGEEDAAIEYLSPPRDRGTRMLKLGEELWIYMPSVDRLQKISGHMLRQGMMGSDVSYEDMMTSRELRTAYEAEVLGAEDLDGRPTWKLEMTARDETVTYARRLTWIDQETFIPLKQQLFALSGMLLKTWIMGEVEEFEGGRRFPTLMVIEDHVRRGSVTRIEIREQRFGVDLEDEVFSLRWLERR